MTPTGGSSLKQHLARGHVVIERIRPQIDCGVHRAKAIVGDEVEVTADIFRDGPSLLQAVIRYRGPSDKRWLEAPMHVVENDRWAGTFKPGEMGRYRYAVQ
ncbi:MAG TPA: maltotransferase domain-containing protein, partial [Actinomycetota bacterium]|nr:maltotransferase domain-containing protein [Actinomycetota bacterium]